MTSPTDSIERNVGGRRERGGEGGEWRNMVSGRGREERGYQEVKTTGVSRKLDFSLIVIIV